MPPTGEAAKPRPVRTIIWSTIALLVLGAVVIVGMFYAVGGFGLFERPPRPFAVRDAPPAPDYAQRQAWLASPGGNGRERSVPPGSAAIDEARALADVFFIHPTTYLRNDVWVVPYDAPDRDAVFNAPVLFGQASVFNGCCRIYAPHYRQASLVGLKNMAAVALAYSDVARAFRYYITHENHGRPFILASHSQGSAHAIRLLQQEILGTPLQKQLIVAYVVGAYVPSNFSTIGLPTCVAAEQTGCILAWNTSQEGRSGARMLIDNNTYWWQGAERNHDQPPAICINPLNWRPEGFVPASRNIGSLPFPRPPFAPGATVFPALVQHLTGAECREGLLAVNIPYTEPFHDMVSLFTGSYHANDYGIFYGAIRNNASLRVNAWLGARK